MSDFEYGSTGIVGGSGQFHIPSHSGDTSQNFGVMKYKYFSHPGNSGTYNRTVNVINDFGLSTQGGVLFYHVHNWPNERSFGMVYWQNPGNAEALHVVSQNKIHESGVSVAAVVSSTSNCIQFNITGSHTNGHGHQFMVWGGR